MLAHHEILGATCAGFVTTVVGHPLDTIKVHLQTNLVAQTTTRGSTWRTAQVLFAQNALFRGIAPPLFNAIVMNTVMFSAFRSIKDVCGNDASMTAGLVSGFATACISTPTDYVKIQAQLRGVNSLQFTRQVLRRHPMSFFRGHTVNLGREGVFTMVYLGLYDQMEPKGFVQVAATSSLTGALAWVASYPFDTVKSVVQGSRRQSGILEAFVSIHNRGGAWAFYRGCLSSTGRAMLVTSLRMITYEVVIEWLSF